MKFVLIFASFFVYAVCEQKEEPKIFRRYIPADVLRDFPGMCFASTLCATVEVGKTWELTPFCGRSTCVSQNDALLELVEDCGPLPLANPKCQLDEEKTNKTAKFPYCCPSFKCEAGAKLEYPDIPTVAPVKEAETTPAPKA
ncbi:hypothetical protein RN001_010873 [Aquatica leii]|uniref:Single domain-containing protein n=1 Tax=Aquatica leii TaxID=1421715 RepID=A0AAN7P774_9COLE|nr:hypothetical protein RN001_010873 [Aquatica leii]